MRGHEIQGVARGARTDAHAKSPPFLGTSARARENMASAAGMLSPAAIASWMNSLRRIGPRPTLARIDSRVSNFVRLFVVIGASSPCKTVLPISAIAPLAARRAKCAIDPVHS